MTVAGWTQSNLFRKQLHLNLRNHRKIMIVDGQVGFMGGINLNGYSRTQGDQPAIRDYHFRLQGPIVQELQYSFLSDWYVMTDEAPEVLLSAKHFQKVPPAGTALARLINSGPASDMHVAVDMFFNAGACRPQAGVHHYAVFSAVGGFVARVAHGGVAGRAGLSGGTGAEQSLVHDVGVAGDVRGLAGVGGADF